MMDRLHKNYILHLLLVPLLVGASAVITGCGGEEEPPPAENQITAPSGETPAPGAENKVDAPATPPGPAMAEIVPSTLPALRFMPEEAQVAVAIPAPPALINTGMPLVRALAEPARDFDAELKQAIQDLGNEVGVKADSYEALASALGVDPAAPVAAFIDFSATVASAAEAKAKYDAELAEQAAKAAPEAPASDSPAEATEPEGSEPAPGEVVDEPAPAQDYFKDADEPNWIVVLGVTDPAKARTEMERIAAADGQLSALESATEDVEGVTITTRDKYGYFTTEKQIVLGHLTLLRGAAKRVNAPANFRYGTVECPPAVADEAVALFYGGRLLPMFEKAMPLLGMDQGGEPLLAAQLVQYKDMFAAGGDDPMVLTASLAGGQLELLSRIDSATHAGMLDKTGQPAPLRLARYLPEKTLALLSLHFSEEYKKQLLEEVVPLVAASQDPNAAASAGMATQVINQIGDELTLGITGGEGGLPTANILLGLSQPEATRGLLQMFVPMEGAVDYEGFSIGKVPAIPGLLEVNLSFVDDFLLASTSEEGAKAIIDLHKAQKASPLFASMQPPMDIEKPVYQTVVLSSTMVTQGLGLAAMLPNSSATLDPGLARVTNAIREVRGVGSLEQGWLTSRLTVYLNDLEAALATSKAMALAAGATAEADEESEEGEEGEDAEGGEAGEAEEAVSSTPAN